MEVDRLYFFDFSERLVDRDVLISNNHSDYLIATAQASQENNLLIRGGDDNEISGDSLVAQTFILVPYAGIKSEQELPDILERWAKYYEIDYSLVYRIVKCESNFNSLAVGDRERAKGLWQIWTSIHAEVSDSCAFGLMFRNRSQTRVKMRLIIY